MTKTNAYAPGRIGRITTHLGKALTGCLFAVFLLFDLGFPSAVLGVSSVNVPLDNWSYGAIEKLVGFGLVQSELKGTRPFSRMEMARLINEALIESERKSSELPSLARYLLQRLEKEYKDELAGINSGGTGMSDTFWKPLGEVQMRYVYSEGEPRRFVGYPESGYSVEATEGTPLVYNNDGVIYGEKSNFSLQFSSYATFKNILSAYLEPIFLFRQNERDIDFQEIDQAEAKLLRGYAKISHWNVEVQAGRDSLWWGQGYKGSLVLTDNAAPLDLVKLSNPTPSLLPWVLKYLGPFKYSLFFSQLEDDRVVPNPWLGGIRVNFKPFPILELGVATTFMFDGEGQPNMTFSDFLDVIGFSFGEEANPNFNQLGAYDIRLRLPFLRNAEIYGEYGGEDSGNLDTLGFDDIGYLVGLYIPRLTDDGRTDLRVEFARNAHKVDQTPGFWYGHSPYRSGYTHDEMVMGHNMEGDAFDVFGRVTRYMTNELLVGLDFDYMERGATLSPVEEENYIGGADASYVFNDWITFSTRYSYGQVKNFELQEGDNRDNHLFMGIVKFQF